MKSGSGDDPFEDHLVEEDADDVEAEAEEPEVRNDVPEIPYVLRRSSVKSSRDNVKQFFLRDHVVSGERDLISEVEDLVGKEVSKLDVREAAYVVAQRHADEIAKELNSWGYEHLE